jgi:hypothetical protein
VASLVLGGKQCANLLPKIDVLPLELTRFTGPASSEQHEAHDGGESASLRVGQLLIDQPEELGTQVPMNGGWPREPRWFDRHARGPSSTATPSEESEQAGDALGDGAGSIADTAERICELSNEIAQILCGRI